MLIIEDKQALLFKLREPGRITTVIPTAKMVKFGEDDLVAVPHRPSETRILRNLGFEVPSPMGMYYKFPAKFKPFEAQRISAEFATMNDRCFILNSMGLGKTITTLWAFDYLRSCGQVKSMLVVCPLSTMERTWADEAFYSFPRYKVNVVYGSREKRIKLLNDPADIYLINTDGIKIIQEELKDRDDIDLIVVDELALFRNAATDRWKSLNIICNKQVQRKVWGLTGSPVPNAPTDAWAQVKLVNPTNPDLPRYYTNFKHRTMLQLSQFKWAPKPDAVNTVHKVMQPAVRFSIDECLDLPEQIVQLKSIQFTPEQSRAYKDMLTRLVAEIGDGEITAANEAIKAGKLNQIALGVAYDEAGNSVQLPCQPRLNELKDTIEASEGKVLVFVPLTGALRSVSEFLTKEGITNRVVDGSTPKRERDEIFDSFQKLGDPRVIVANPAAMSHGLTLTAATTIVWYGLCYSNEIYQQACARVRRPGQTKTTVIVHFISTKLEQKIYDRLQSRQSLQGTLLELMRETTNHDS